MAGKKTGENSMQYTVIKLRLHPTREQAELMEKTFGCCRYLWNRMLDDAQEFYAATELQYIPTPAHYKKEAPFLGEVDSQALCAVHQNLRRAYLNFFRSPSAFRYPRRKTKKARRDAFTVCCRPYRTGPSIRLERDGLRMPKLGLVKARVHRRPLHWWSLRSVTVSRTRSGKYFAAVSFGYPVKTPETVSPAPETTLTMGPLDLKLPETAGDREKLERMQRKLSRMVRGSRNYAEQLQRLRLQHERIANRRKDFIHKESRRIANAWDAVCLTDAASAAAPSGFGMFQECLRYKLERQGKTLLLGEVPASV